MDDIQEIKADVKELLQRSAVHNMLLETHEARSLALQSSQEKLDLRIKPIEDHVSLINKVGKVLGAILVGIVIQYAVKKVMGLI